MNLIICTTPFQMLMAEKILDLYKEEDFELHLFCNVMNKKYNHYFNRLARKVTKSKIYVFNRKSKIKYLFFLIRLKLNSLFSKKIDRLFIGSIDNNHVHVHVHVHKYIHNNTKLYTFDDGTANIFPESFFYKEDFSYKNYLLRYILCNKTNLKTIKDKSLKHYSIYHGKKNIIANVEHINLFISNVDGDYSNNGIKNEKVRVLIGQPIYENISSVVYDELKYSNLVKNIMCKYNIDYYFPHPRECFNIRNVEYINTGFILEDYILQGINNGNKYELFTFFSGGVISFNNIKQVKIISLKLRLEDLRKYYKIMKDIDNILFIEEDLL